MGIILEMKSNMYVLLTVLKKMCLFSFLLVYVSLAFEQCHIKKNFRCHEF